MSAGDVLFVGWTGTNPNYKEMEPSFSYEPYRENRPPSGTGIFAQSVAIDQYIRVQMTRRIICFNKDKATIISSLGFENVTNSLTYIDTDGSVKTKTVGAGWTLKTISESALAPGYSNVNVMYEKVEHKGLAFPSSGLSFICDSGVCKINYNGTDIETIDSGTGECTTGINAVVQAITKAPNLSILTENINPEEYQNLVYFKLSIFCNNVESDFVEIKGSDLQLQNYPLQYLTPANTKTAKRITSEERTEFYNFAPLTQEQKNEILQAYQSRFPNTEYANFQFEFTKQIDEQIKSGIDLAETGNISEEERLIFFDSEEAYWDITFTEYIKTKATFKFPSERAPSFAFQKEGNVIKLVASGGGLKEKIIWREWDVTGL